MFSKAYKLVKKRFILPTKFQIEQENTDQQIIGTKPFRSKILKIILVEFDIFTIGKRLGSLKSWEPFYIGTHFDPLYDERLYWEGRRDKMTQVIFGI